MIPSTYAWRSLWVRRASTIAMTAGVALVVFVLAASQMLANGLRSTLGASGRDDRAIVLEQSAYAEANSRLMQSMLGMVAAMPGVKSGADGQLLVTGEVVSQLQLPSTQHPDRIVSVFVRGVSGNVMSLRPQVRVIDGRVPEPGKDEGMVGKRLLGRYQGTQLGGAIELKAGRKIPIVGVFEAQGSALESELWVDLDAMRSSLGWEGYYSSVTVQLGSKGDFPAFAQELEQRSLSRAVAEIETSYYARMSRRISSMISELGGIVAAIFSFGAMLGAAITMYSSVSQRTKEIGVFRALGFDRTHILQTLLCETGTVAALGAVMGLGLALALSTFQLSTWNGATGSQLIFQFEPTLALALSSTCAGTVVGLLGGLWPALAAARMNPLDALRI